MKSVNCSITGLTKSAETFKTMLEKAGFHVDVEVFKTGNGGNAHFGPSFVNIAISDEDGFHLTDTKVHAGGFGEVVTWKSVKVEILEKLMQVSA
jgi:hypothetical protein